MVAPVPLRESVFLKIDKALIDEITTESGFKLHLVPEYNFEHNATVTGSVTLLPKDYKGDIKIGDEVAFSYRVVSDRTFPSTADWFVPVVEPSDSVRIWMNSKGEKVRMMAIPGKISMMWTGTFFDSKGEFIHGAHGTEREVERWISQFKFGNAQHFIYKNLFELDGTEYWKCRMDNVFAKKTGDEIIPVGDRIVCEIMEIPLDRRVLIERGIHVPDSSVALRYKDRAVVVAGGEKLGIKKGDVISFEPEYCEAYELWGKKYFLIRERRVQGIWN